ncbi:MAG: M14 family metallopeptidase [Pseudomonadota bacterium]
MSDNLTVGNLTAESGTKVQGYLEVVNCEIKMPVTLINSANPGKTVLITGGMHGGEYPGIETGIRLSSMLNPQDISGRLIIVHVVNTPAFFAKLQYVGPYDGKNLNREYPGIATGTISQKIAYTVSSQMFTKADFYIDLHSGDIHEKLTSFVFYSLLSTPEKIELSKQAATLAGFPYVVGSLNPVGALGGAAQMGIPGLLIENGNCGLWSEEDVENSLSGIQNILRFLEVLPGKAKNLCDVEFFKKTVNENARDTGCWYPFVTIGDLVKEGQKLGEIKNLFGQILSEYFAIRDGRVLYHTSSLAINVGDPLIAYA